MSMPRGLIAALVLGLGACMSAPSGPDLPILDRFPDCRFRPLGEVIGQDGQSADLSETTAGKRGSDRVARVRLRQAAAALGADAVVLVRREVQEPMYVDMAQVRQPPRLIILHGVAIRDCR